MLNEMKDEHDLVMEHLKEREKNHQEGNHQKKL